MPVFGSAMPPVLCGYAPDLRLRAATSHHIPPHCSRLQGGGIQIQQGPKAGRLVVPTIAVYSNASSCPISSDCWAAGTHDHALVSDDGGITWASGTPCAKRTRLFTSSERPLELGLSSCQCSITPFET